MYVNSQINSKPQYSSTLFPDGISVGMDQSDGRRTGTAALSSQEVSAAP